MWHVFKVKMAYKEKGYAALMVGRVPFYWLRVSSCREQDAILALKHTLFTQTAEIKEDLIVITGEKLSC